MLRVERLVTRQLVLTTRTVEDGGPLSLDQLRSRYQRLATGRSSDGSEL